MQTRMLKGAKFVALCAVLSAPVWAAAAEPQAVEQLARDSGCLSCHSINEKVVGPAYKSVAAKYRGQSDAVDHLVQSVRNGSKGTWGRIPMPPHSSMSEAELKQLVTWVLSQ